MSNNSMMMHGVTAVKMDTDQQSDIAVLTIYIRGTDGRPELKITCFSPYLTIGQKHEWVAVEKTENPPGSLATYEYKTTPKNCDKCGQPICCQKG